MDHSAIPSFEITAPINPGFRLIEASAGTGKTFTVGGIYLRLVIELNIPVQKILVVTFTNAATQELSTRLRDRLRDFESLLDNNGGAHSDPVFNHILTKTLVDNSREVLLERVRRALVEFDEAKICTIHGFCQRLLSDQFFLAGEFVDFVLEPSDNLAHEEYSRRCFETWVEAKPFLFLAWLRKLKYGPSRLVELLRLAEKHPLVDLHLENTNNDFPDVAAESFMKKVRVFVDGVWCNEVGKSFRNSIWRGIEEGVLNKNSYRFNAASFEERILKCEQMLCDLAQGVGIFDGEVLEKIRPSYLKSKTKKSMSLDLHGESCGDLIEELYDDWGVLEEKFREGCLHFEKQLITHYQKSLLSGDLSGREKSFSDLLTDTYRLVQSLENDPKRLGEVAGEFEACLIDEFQDTDQLQWTIFQKLFVEQRRRVIGVGDPKQAIYGFRGADVQTYFGVKESCSDLSGLNTNWRSDGRLIMALNGLWRFPGQSSEFDHAAVLAAKEATRWRNDSGARVPFLLRSIRPSEVGSDAKKVKFPSKAKALELCLRAMVLDILDFLGSSPMVEVSNDCWRSVSLNDCSVLVRKNSEAEAVSRALAEVDLSATILGHKSIFETEDAKGFALFLGALESPGNQYLIYQALQSRFFGLSVRSLKDFLDSSETAAAWSRLFVQWRHLWIRFGPMAVVEECLVHEARGAQLFAKIGGERCVVNWRQLAEMVQKNCADERWNLELSGRWLARGIEGKIDAEGETEVRLDKDFNAIRILTVHKSKGLEFPFVFCPFLSFGSAARIPSWPFVYHGKEEGEVRVAFGELLDAVGTKDAWSVRAQEVQEEEMRLLYVALTRARHRLWVYYVPTKTGANSSLGRLLHGHQMLDSTSATFVKDGWSDSVASLVCDDLLSITEIETETSVESTGGRPSFGGTDTEVGSRIYTGPKLDAVHFRKTSFTELIAGHDFSSEGGLVRPESSLLPIGTESERILLADFPKGKEVGIFLHQILEKYVGAGVDEDGLEYLIRTEIVNSGLSRWPMIMEKISLLTQWLLEEVVKARFDAGGSTPVTLSDLRGRTSLVEFDFQFLVGDSETEKRNRLARIACVLMEEQHPLVSDFGALLKRKYKENDWRIITGSADLVFPIAGMEQEKWSMVDYKSNFLGERVDDYSYQHLAENVLSHGYILQSYLYVFALHLFLKSRLLDEYDYETHVGHFSFLFLRAMSSSFDGRGVLSIRPSFSAIRKLEEIFRVGEGRYADI